MALTIEITKETVSEQMDKLWNITFNMKLFDGSTEVVFEQDFSTRYRTGEDIADKESEVQTMMQDAIDDYKDEQVIFDHAKMDTMVTNLNNNLVG